MTYTVRPTHYNPSCNSTHIALMSFPLSAKQQHTIHCHLDNVVAQLVRMIEESGKPLTQQCKIVTALKQQLTSCLPDTPEAHAIAAEMDRVMQTMLENMNRTVASCEKTQKAQANCAYLKFNSTNDVGYYVTTTKSKKHKPESYTTTMTPKTGGYSMTATQKGRFNYQLTEDEALHAEKAASEIHTVLVEELGADDAHKMLAQAIRHAEQLEQKL